MGFLDKKGEINVIGEQPEQLKQVSENALKLLKKINRGEPVPTRLYVKKGTGSINRTILELDKEYKLNHIHLGKDEIAVEVEETSAVQQQKSFRDLESYINAQIKYLKNEIKKEVYNEMQAIRNDFLVQEESIKILSEVVKKIDDKLEKIEQINKKSTSTLPELKIDIISHLSNFKNDLVLWLEQKLVNIEEQTKYIPVLKLEEEKDFSSLAEKVLTFILNVPKVKAVYFSSADGLVINKKAEGTLDIESLCPLNVNGLKYLTHLGKELEETGLSGELEKLTIIYSKGSVITAQITPEVLLTCVSGENDMEESPLIQVNEITDRYRDNLVKLLEK